MKTDQKKPTALPDRSAFPRHVGIIMDGNGRWAKKRHLPRYAGHSVGVKTFLKIVEYAASIGIEYMTFYAFSTENWKRPEREVSTIMRLMRDYLGDFERYRALNTRVRFLGDLSGFDDVLRERMLSLERESAGCTGMRLNIAANYGGRGEIVRAVMELAVRVKEGGLTPEEIDEAALDGALDTAGMPDVDLIIRPSGEQRLSNFLIWQSAYAEFVFMDVLWPDFTPDDLDRALREYAGRSRRFGGV